MIDRYAGYCDELAVSRRRLLTRACEEGSFVNERVSEWWWWCAYRRFPLLLAGIVWLLISVVAVKRARRAGSSVSCSTLRNTIFNQFARYEWFLHIAWFVLDYQHINLTLSRRIAISRWQTVTATEITPALLTELSHYASEYLIHAADVEGLCKGIDEELVAYLSVHSPLPCTYAGGGKDLADIDLVWWFMV